MCALASGLEVFQKKKKKNASKKRRQHEIKTEINEIIRSKIKRMMRRRRRRRPTSETKTNRLNVVLYVHVKKFEEKKNMQN